MVRLLGVFDGRQIGRNGTIVSHACAHIRLSTLKVGPGTEPIAEQALWQIASA